MSDFAVLCPMLPPQPAADICPPPKKREGTPWLRKCHGSKCISNGINLPYLSPGIVSLCFYEHVHDKAVIASGGHSQGSLPMLKVKVKASGDAAQWLGAPV